MSNEIFFTSDLHFGHGNVIKYSNRPFMDQFERHEYDKAKANLTPAEYREFERRFKLSRQTVERMDNTMIERFNSKVLPNSTVYILGDVAFYKEVSTTISLLKRMNGRKILIAGNHDKYMVKDRAFRDCFEQVRDFMEIKHENQSITLCHYAMLTWNKSHHGAWMLHGHSHGSLPDDNTQLRIDVGVDCHDFYPISFSEVKEIMSKKKYAPIDHHGE